jgi:two-component system sensor histidine kinase UhpB
MDALTAYLTHLWQRFFYLPILRRVFIANTIVIIIGAVGGTLLTRQLVLFGNLRLILLFASLGIGLTLLVNYMILRTSLQPLQDLRNAVLKVESGQTTLLESTLMQADPDIHDLVVAINAMLERLEGRTSQLRLLSEGAINMQEEERKRIARALHDDTAQAVSTILLQLERLENELPEERTDLKKRLGESRQLAARMLEDLRKNIWDLRPTILDDLGLVPAIRWYARTRLEETGARVNFDLDEEIRLEPYQETMLFRICQEAVGNVQRHARAENVAICLAKEAAQVCLEIKDDGRGFDVERTAEEAVSRKQLGILGIQERVSLVGGKVKVESTPGQGTCLHVCIPLLNNSWTVSTEPGH